MTATQDAIHEAKLSAWRNRWNNYNDRQRQNHEAKLIRDIRLLRIAICKLAGWNIDANNIVEEATTVASDMADENNKTKLTGLIAAYRDKQAEHELVLNGQYLVMSALEGEF